MPSYHPRIASLDLETGLFRAGYPCPLPVCAQYAGPDCERGLVVASSDKRRFKLLCQQALERAEVGTALVGSHIAYDMGVLYEHLPELQELIWAAYDAGGIWELGDCQRLIQISTGAPQTGVGLEDLCRMYSYVLPVSKADDTRTTYWQYYGRPVEDYSPKHLTYALHDALGGRHVGSALLARSGKAGVSIPQLQFESQVHWALHLISCRGMKIDPDRVQVLAAGARAEEARLRALATSLRYVRESGSKDTATIAKAVSEAYGGHPPTTPTNKVSIAGEVLEESGDEALKALAQWGHWQKVVNTDLKILGQGILHTRYGMANSTRTTASKPPVQNWPKEGGMRECVVARDGMALLSADVKGLESATCAQVLVNEWGYWDLANRINRGVDPLIEFAAEYSGRSYEDIAAGVEAGDVVCKQLRQTAKGPIYGLPGAMGAETLRIYLANYNVDVTLEEASRLKKVWQRLYPQTVAAHRHISDRMHDPSTDTYWYRIDGSHGLHRRGATFPAACNGKLLQSLGAQMMKWIVYQTVRDSHIGAMRGFHATIFEHDAIVGEAPLDQLDDLANKLHGWFNAGFAKYCPDIRMSTEVAASDRWSKKAKRIVDSEGRLQVCLID